MRNLKRWKRLMAVAMCSAMMLSVPMGVSATDSGDTQAPVTDNAEIVDTDTDTSDDTDTDTSDGTDTPDGSGDVTPPTDNDGTDTDAGDGTENDGTEEDGGEDTGKTKVTINNNAIDGGVIGSLVSGNFTNYTAYFTVQGVSEEILTDIINVEIASAKVGDVDSVSAIKIKKVRVSESYDKLFIVIDCNIDHDKLLALLSGKESGGYKAVIEYSITSNNELYELEVNNNTNSFLLSYSGDNRQDISNTSFSISDVSISKTRMQELVEVNKTKDIVIKTPSGLSYVFKKGDFNLVGDKDEYNFDVTLSTNFSTSGIKNTNVTADIFACRINYAYNGQLPGTAYISIPVDSKWNGRTLYYYQIMSDGTLKDTGLRNTVANGICEVSQSHCSDYVLLAKSPSELGIASVNGQDTNASARVTSPKTGDTTTVLLFVFLCMGALVVGTGAIAIRRKSN